MIRSMAGLLLLDKPLGATSHDVVKWVRRELREKRVGHAGTLDPLASGLLPCLVGPATRLASHLHSWPKTYVGLIQLGEETETGDLDGAQGLPQAPMPPLHVIEAARRRFLGSQQQLPPAYSAKKVGGVRAHTLARQGFPPSLSAVAVTIHALRLSPVENGRLAFATKVSSGTYIRALARDLGRFFGTGAHLVLLRRVGIGPLRVRSATLAVQKGEREMLINHLIPMEQIPLPFPTRSLSRDEERRFRNGQPLASEYFIDGTTRALDEHGRLIGLGLASEQMLRPTVVLPAE